MSGTTPFPATTPAPVLGAIPPWTLSGVLPPYLGNPTSSISMAPYSTTLVNVVERFATTPKRIEILEGFLLYRKALAAVGIIDGFQWLNGSILEDIESLESREPKDIDVVTFFRRPMGARDPLAWGQFGNSNRTLFSPQANKASFKTDTQYIDLDSTTEEVALLTRFWFGLFSHRRNDLWKGMLSIPLQISSDDTIAVAKLLAKRVPLTPVSGAAP